MKVLFLIHLIFFLQVGNPQQTYYGNNPRGCCGEEGLNPMINWDTNYICNGDF